MTTLKEIVLSAARADSIPEGRSGLWAVKKLRLAKPYEGEDNGRRISLPAGCYTQLFRMTTGSIHRGGECVMHDFPEELRKHLAFMLRARGRVLITGLGLGCVVRGAMANDAVDSVTVVERDRNVLKLVEPHMPQGRRLQIIKGNALAYVKTTKEKFDCAWHDLWTDEEAGEPHLQVRHMELICEMTGRVKLQGAWMFPRYFRRTMDLI